MEQDKNTERDLAEDLHADLDIRAKMQNPAYAHKMYAALCNTKWQPAEVMDILKELTWQSSWRSTGGIVAELRDCGEDYLDWYCSGYEGYVHPDIRADLKRIGWVCVEEDDPEEFGGAPPDNMWTGEKGIAGALSSMSETALAEFRAVFPKESKK